jgi:hypothetical protein
MQCGAASSSCASTSALRRTRQLTRRTIDSGRDTVVSASHVTPHADQPALSVDVGHAHKTVPVQNGGDARFAGAEAGHAGRLPLAPGRFILSAEDEVAVTERMGAR